MALTRSIRHQTAARWAFGLLLAACIVPLVLRSLPSHVEPSIRLEWEGGGAKTVGLSDLKAMPVLTRLGSYQNQYGNWRDEGIYSGTRIVDLLQDRAYSAIEIEAADGYRVRFSREQVEDPNYPVVLAFRFNEHEVPDWPDGFRVAVLPEDGGVSNADYGAGSAGSYWLKQITRLLVLP